MKYKRKRIILKNFEFLQKLGNGKTSEVFLVLNTENKKHQIVKIFKKKEMIIKKYVKRIAWELRILSNLDHWLFPEMIGTSQTNSEFFLFMEFIPGGDFYFYQINMDSFSLQSGRFYIAQLVLMLEKLHSMNIVFRDLKPENIMVAADGYLKLIDFGCSIYLKDKTKKTYTLCGTPEFMAPEMILKTGHSFGVDLWALGIFIFEMFSDKGPFFSNDPMKLYMKTLKVEYSFPFDFPETLKSLVNGLLQKKPSQRLGMLKNSMNDIKENILFNDFNWKLLSEKKIVPPLIPKVKNDKDITNFPKFSSERSLVEAIDPSTDPFILW